MSDKPTSPQKNLSPDWLVHGVLTKLGDTFDRLTGRGWKPSSSLATSELIEKLKRLLDTEARESAEKRIFVPHNIKLKMQWDKFSTDAEESLRKLENELLTAAVDHINDRRYYTYAPLSIEVKPDYFTSGVKLFISFDKFTGEEHEAELNVSIPGASISDLIAEEAHEPEPIEETYIARFSENGKDREVRLVFTEGRRFSVGRTRENDLAIDDPSISKIHASLVLNGEGGLLLADTGSTNGTFVDGERISYGKALTLPEVVSVTFGAVKVTLEHLPKPPVVKRSSPEAGQADLESDHIQNEFGSGSGPFPISSLPETEASVEIPDQVSSRYLDHEK